MNRQRMNVKIIKESDVYDVHTSNKTLLETRGQLAVVSARSILSTEIMKRLQPLVGTKWSPYKITNDIMDSIQLEEFIGIQDSELIENLLYNEFYKISLEITSYADVNELSEVINGLRPTINSIILLLGRVKTNDK